MPKMHTPTLGATVVLILVAFVAYHFLCNKK